MKIYSYNFIKTHCRRVVDIRTRDRHFSLVCDDGRIFENDELNDTIFLFPLSEKQREAIDKKWFDGIFKGLESK